MKTHKKYIAEYKTSYRVRIKIGLDKVVKYFNFVKCDGKQNALKAAVKWRNATLKKHGLIIRLRYRKSPDRYASEKKINPIIGVYQSFSNGGSSHNWTARISIGQYETKRHFSISKYGNEEAFLNACDARYQYAKELIVINPDQMPCEPLLPYRYQNYKTRMKDNKRLNV